MTWPLGITLGLSAVVLANLVMMTFALRHPSLPAERDPYGVEDEAARRAQTAAPWNASWQVDVRPCTACEGLGDDTTACRCMTTVGVTDRDGAPVSSVEGEVAFEWGNVAAFDRTLALVQASPGVYRVEAELARGGMYTVHVRLRAGASALTRTFRHEARWTSP